MQGLLNSPVGQPVQASQQPSDSGAPAQTNPLLQNIENGIEAKIRPQDRKDYLAIIVAGNHVLFSPKTLPMFTQIVKQPNFMQEVPQKMANLMALISNQSGKNAQGQPLMNATLIGPASMVLTCHVLGFAAQATGVQLTPEIIAKQLHDVIMAVLQKFGINPQQVQQAQKAQGA